MNTNRRNFIKNAALATAGLTIFPQILSSCGKKTIKRPNLLFIFADQYRRPSLGFLKQDPVRTPNIDGIARNGVFFSNTVSNHPLCSPFRGMLMTGKYPLSNGVISNCNSGRTEYGNFLKSDETCFSDVLAKNNYNAGYVGKWHLNGPEPTKPGEPKVWDDYCPLGKDRHGFDFWYAYGTSNSHNTPHYWINDAKEEEVKRFNQWSAEHEAEVIIDYLKNDKNHRDDDKPFSLFWGINPPHSKFDEVPERYKKRFEGKTPQDVLNRENVQYKNNQEFKGYGIGDQGVEQKIHHATNYFAMVEGVDDQIGRVIEELKKQDLYDNTIIVFTSDHGEMMGSQGLMHKNVWFKESFEIPFVMSWPDGLKTKGEDDLLLSVPDMMPTLLSLMGMKNDIPTDVEGNDFADILRGKEMDRPEAALYFFAKPEDMSTQRRGIKTHNYTYIVAIDVNHEKLHFLYDDKNDPFQKTNIYHTNEKLAKQANGLLKQTLKNNNDPFISQV